MQVYMLEIAACTTGRRIAVANGSGQAYSRRRTEPFTDSGRKLRSESFECILYPRHFQRTDSTGQRDKHMIEE